MTTGISTPTTGSKPLWYQGVCDTLYQKVKAWNDYYESGDISRTRKAMDLQGAVIDVPVQYAHKIPWTLSELDHLVRILIALHVEASLAADISDVKINIRKARVLPGGQYLATMVFWKQDVADILAALEKAKGGQNAFEEYAQRLRGQG